MTQTICMLSSQSLPSKKSFTVLQVVPALNVGGVERGTVEFAQFLKQNGHRPIVVSAGGILVDELQRAGIQHITLNVNKKSLTCLFSVRKLRALMSEHAVDLVHARSRVPAWLCHLAIKKMNSAKPKFVTTLHGLHSVNHYSAIMARGDQVIAVSEAAKSYLETHFSDYLRQQPIVINRGIDKQFTHGYQADQAWLKALEKQHPEINQGKKLLLPGRLTRIKGVENLLPWLEQTDANNRLLLTATKDESKYSNQVAHLMQQRGVAHKVSWLGIQRNMPDLYASVDLVVSVNNKPESFGRTVLEALTIGTPVVAFASGGVAELMQKLYPAGGILTHDTAELAARIESFLVNPPPVKAHQQYKNQTMFEQTLKVYGELLNG